MEENRTVFGRMPDGTEVEEITLRALGPEDHIYTCKIITYGGAVRSLTMPDRDGRPVDVVLGFDTLEDYMTQDKYLGALVGRYANRIGRSRFTLNGVEYPLAVNDGENSLHGGAAGFDKQVWTVEEFDGGSSVTLSLVSPDMQEGYPGTLSVRVTYTLSDGSLAIDYWAKSDKDTICNLTNHSYFNLSGHDSGRAEGQYIKLWAGRYTPTVPGLIPTGEIAPVDGTPMDLREAQPIREHIGESFEQLTMAGGYDHNWVIDKWNGTIKRAAAAWSPDTGIAMHVLTTLPGVQFYAGNFLHGCPAGKGGTVYDDRHGFCLETQYFPDSPNQPEFPSCVLKAGEEYHSTTIYSFLTLNSAAEL